MIQIPLLAGHHRAASETQFNGVSQACRLWPNIECWLGSFAILRGSGRVLLKTFVISNGGPDPLSPIWIRA